MAQSGLHVHAEDGCFTMNNYVLCDIGDGQSITENLSTFSSHMTNIIEILRLVDDQALVLLDELGSGTDPAEGMGLAIAILEELAGKNCLFVATTHYPEIKDYAKSAKGLINARMTFDRQSLLPLYQLEIGEAGESCALYIARRLGLPQRMIERAVKAAYGNRTHTNLSIPEDFIIPSQDIAYNKQPSQRVKKQEVKKAPDNPRCMKFNIGDSVIVYPQKMIGIVYHKANEKGEIGVQIKKKKLLINHKRLKLHVPASELYPEDYDFSIIFDSVENRKTRHKMDKGHNPDLVIKYEEKDLLE
jgi:dsDNA-specific endonuclease/ATPase MutS2